MSVRSSDIVALLIKLLFHRRHQLIVTIQCRLQILDGSKSARPPARCGFRQSMQVPQYGRYSLLIAGICAGYISRRNLSDLPFGQQLFLTGSGIYSGIDSSANAQFWNCRIHYGARFRFRYIVSNKRKQPPSSP